MNYKTNYKNGNLNQKETVKSIVIDWTDRAYPFTATEIVAEIRAAGITPAELSNKKIRRVLQNLAGTADVIESGYSRKGDKVRTKLALWFVKTETTYSYNWPNNTTKYVYTAA